MESNYCLRCNLINIQSVGNKTNKIKSLIVDNKLDICMLTETWLSNNISDNSKISEMTPKSFDLYHIPRDDRNGGGVGVLIKKAYITSVINQRKFNSFENINIKINHVNRNFQIILIYKPPNTRKREFIDEFSSLLDTVTDNRNLLICGNFNLHFENEVDNYVNEFRELLESHDLENCVNDPTTKSNHLIDLVIQNKDRNIVSELEVEPDCTISPVHKLISFNVKVWRSTVAKKLITYRNKTNFNAEKFIDGSITEI